MIAPQSSDARALSLHAFTNMASMFNIQDTPAVAAMLVTHQAAGGRKSQVQNWDGKLPAEQPLLRAFLKISLNKILFIPDHSYLHRD